MGDAEALLLVDDQQAEVAKGHVLGEQPMGADEDVDLAGGQLLEDRRLLGLAAEARHHVDLDRERRRGAPEASRRCWKASTVVGASIATCLPSITALNAARSATSVLP